MTAISPLQTLSSVSNLLPSTVANGSIGVVKLSPSQSGSDVSHDTDRLDRRTMFISWVAPFAAFLGAVQPIIIRELTPFSLPCSVLGRHPSSGRVGSTSAGRCAPSPTQPEGGLRPAGGRPDAVWAKYNRTAGQDVEGSTTVLGSSSGARAPLLRCATVAQVQRTMTSPCAPWCAMGVGRGSSTSPRRVDQGS